MSQADEPPRFNPYASPTSSVGPLTPLTDKGANADLLKTFRQQMHALGALWIIIGGLALVVGAALLGVTQLQVGPFARIEPEEALATGIAAIVAGGLWMAAGIAACFKQMWAVYMGLVLSYLNAISAVFTLNICAGILMVMAIIQGHRVLRFAGQLRRAGIPVTTKPDELQPK